MRKGPLFASITIFVIAIIMIITGSSLYEQGEWSDYLLWFGLASFGIGLIVLVVSFIKKPGEESKTEEVGEAKA